ncbi:PBP1A family penicillin-binding protein [bacterium]|nr:PBP1A family penicillin-binding protein [bacterium]
MSNWRSHWHNFLAKLLARYWWCRQKLLIWGRDVSHLWQNLIFVEVTVTRVPQNVIYDSRARAPQLPKTDTFKRPRPLANAYRTLARHWHSLWHRHTYLPVAHPEKIDRYYRRNLKVIVRSGGGSVAAQLFWGSVSFALSFGILFGGWWFYDHIIADLPDITQLSTAKQNMTTKIFDRNQHLLYEVYEDENRTPVSLSRVSPDLVNATMAIEDRTFREHRGFDLKAIIRAFRANQESGTLSQGGSTITQQLVKQRLLTSEKTFTRKIKELILAILVEGNYTKDDIMEMYLNQVNYGGPVYGVEQAAITFFGKNAADLTLAESAFLAGLPQAPSRYSPFANDIEGSYRRRTEVLRRMREDGYITPAQEASANAEILSFQDSQVNIQAPHFVMYVQQKLADMYGQDMVNTGGLTVRTTLDLQVQNDAQRIVTDEVDSLARLRVSNGAAMVTRPQTGEILAMVGSRDYFDRDRGGQVNVCLRLRQPGSSIKPLNYATAMEYFGYTPATLILDAPVTYAYKGGPSYSPKNYDGSYHGNVTLRSSLANSYNIPAVKVLNDIGKDAFIDQAEKMGITTWTDRSRLGLSLTLGGGDVYMIDMMEAYGTFANYGLTVTPDPILEVMDYQGNVIYRNACALDGECADRSRRTLSAATSYQIASILSDNQARTPAFGANSVLHIPGQEVAVKTGTTNSLRDNWTFGYTRDYVVGVWVGNNDNRPMSYVASGITGASPIWQKIFLTLLDPDNPSHFDIPSGIVAVDYCGRTEYFKENQIPPIKCPAPPAPPEAEGKAHEGEST